MEPPLAYTNTYKIGSENHNRPGAASALSCTRKLGGWGDQGSVTGGPTQNHGRWIQDNSPQTTYLHETRTNLYGQLLILLASHLLLYQNLLTLDLKFSSIWLLP